MQDFIDQSHDARRKAGRGIHIFDTADLARIARLAACMERERAAISAAADLKAGQFQVLAELRSRDPWPMTATDLAYAIVITSGGLTPVLDQLEGRGLVTRQIDPEDRRARRIAITEKGRSLIARALDQQTARHRALNSVLSVEERETLNGILRKLLVAVEGRAP
jgi:DNA-binding MarR family transcriptional regulator